jgi:hypothetical protein
MVPGKEGVDGSSPSEGFRRFSCVMGWFFQAASGHERFVRVHRASTAWTSVRLRVSSRWIIAPVAKVHPLGVMPAPLVRLT